MGTVGNKHRLIVLKGWVMMPSKFSFKTGSWCWLHHRTLGWNCNDGWPMVLSTWQKPATYFNGTMYQCHQTWFEIHLSKRSCLRGVIIRSSIFHSFWRQKLQKSPSKLIFLRLRNRLYTLKSPQYSFFESYRMV